MSDDTPEDWQQRATYLVQQVTAVERERDTLEAKLAEALSKQARLTALAVGVQACDKCPACAGLADAALIATGGPSAT